ncbi:GNAT domain-containing protein [Boeremia exigua]|uniref:GNAT domain-containing protein n=1 Tax=Boeremia exigua TaxID=749465 RepID=UPI001E8D9E55|nr:GNAT domain-containing protein [Boeremia exigua]KAH6612660.1 GNAT domain-containing protein [Boeremia exigua]
MEHVLTTSRLKLTLITQAARGSDELKWLHELRSNKQSTLWSMSGPSKTLEETENVIANYVPDPISDAPPTADAVQKLYKIAYAVHEILSVPDTPSTAEETRFIGLVNLVSLAGKHLPLPPHLVIPAEDEKMTLVVELAYSFLPPGWGKGYATEALTAVLDACRSPKSREFWQPWEKVWMRAIVNGRNLASQKVMRKMGPCGVSERGVFEWKGEPIFIGGEWMTEDDLHIFGGYLKE